jgi:intracellular protein transport protein USO1
MAFSGAFDNLLTVIEAEGGIEGGVVVQDALAVLTVLLKGNLSNQV